MKKETQLASLACDPDRYGGVVNLPVHRASTILFPTLEDFEQADQVGWSTATYGRYGTPTTDALEKMIASLEGADNTIVTASGLSAIVTALTACLNTGDHLLMVDTTYGPTRRFCNHELKQFGVETTYYDPLLGADIAKLFKPNTKVVYVESPGSLTFEMQDVPAIAKVAHAHGAMVIGDNTWGTPLYYDAFKNGCDISIQSVTKYMAGHSDLVMGAISCKEKHYERLHKVYKHLGPTPSGDNCYLVMRGLRSMAARMQMQQKNALRIAEWLQARPEVDEVIYPALPGSRGHDIWKRDMTGAASLFGFVLKPVEHDKLSAMMNGLEYFGMGYSWGGFESLMIPITLGKLRSATAPKFNGPLLRIHVGLEDPDDLMRDLEAGFARLRAK